MNDVSKDDTIFILGDGIRFEPEKRCLINDFGTVINLPENSYRFLLLLLEGRPINKILSIRYGTSSAVQ